MNRYPRSCTRPDCTRNRVEGSRLGLCLPHLTGHPSTTARPAPDLPAVQVRRGARDTSSGAALRALPRSGTHRAVVLEHLRERGEYGATDDELMMATGLGANTVRPRRVELVSAGWCRDSGKRRPSAAGSPAAVWVIVP